MKPQSAFIIFLLPLFVFANELAWVDEQIDAIKPPRPGVVIISSSDPFIFLEKNKSPKKEGETASSTIKPIKKSRQKSSSPFALMDVAAPKELTKNDFTITIIMNNSAMINGKWYKKGERIYDFVIAEINRDFVLLTNAKKSITLSTAVKNSAIKFKNK